MTAAIVVGGHFGDEGKGKIISYLALKDNPSIIARAGVGPNAGHTVYRGGKKYGLRMIPCGFVNPKARLFIGAGVLVDIERFLMEVEMTQTKGRVFVDKRCAVIEARHKEEDTRNSHLKGEIGSTGMGCGPANAERAYRTIKLAQDFPELKDYVADAAFEVNSALDRGEHVLVEASQGFGLSLFYGTYPYVTSKDTSASMAASDVGLGPTRVDDVIVVYKAYTTRVGGGVLETEINDENVKNSRLWLDVLEEAKKKGIIGEHVNEILAKYLGEVGTVTGRPRRVGDFDFKLAKYSAMVNGATHVCVTCVDKIFPECYGVGEYDKLSERAKAYLKNIEKELKVNATLISTGPDVMDVIDLR